MKSRNGLIAYLYTKVLQDSKTDEYSYCWLTKPEDGRFAKDRLGILPAIIPQDFNLVFSKYEEAGIYHPNILVIGESVVLANQKPWQPSTAIHNRQSKLKIAS